METRATISATFTGVDMTFIAATRADIRGYRSIGGLLLTAVVGLLVCVCAVSAAPRGDPASQYEELRAQYLSLRNTDVQGAKAAEWESLLGRFTAFVDAYPRRAESPGALFHAATLMEDLFHKFGGRDRAERSLRLYERLAKEYPGATNADDAIARGGDLALYGLGDEAWAEKLFEELASAYPESDLFDLAKIRLRQIEDGSYRRKAAGPTDDVADRSSTKPLIVIDPGHGGEDLGASGVGGLLEKDIVLDVALRLERRLQKEVGAIVRLTRRKDVFVPLAERTNLANDFDADLFISLHVNASPSSNLSGFETFYLDNTDDQASKSLAERENRSIQFESAPNDLQFMLSDLIQNAKLDDSIVFAHTVHRSLFTTLGKRFGVIPDLGVRKAPFYVLVGAHMPCILVELLFVDHKEDGKKLANEQFREALAQGVSIGVQRFLAGTRVAAPVAASRSPKKKKR